tara:strand:+ start:8913 stop:9410 length:498 start_codon:yes stop_codon:yes gene_type:complete
MALVKGNTYDSIYFDFVLDGVRDILISEYESIKSYIAPQMSHHDNFQIRLWGPEASTENWWTDTWQKEYTVEIFIYFIEKNPTEDFYKQMYADVERIYQLLFNNKTYTKTVTTMADGALERSSTFTWTNGEVDDMEINNMTEEDEEIDGLHVSTLNFTCLVEREG